MARNTWSTLGVQLRLDSKDIEHRTKEMLNKIKRSEIIILRLLKLYNKIMLETMVKLSRG